MTDVATPKHHVKYVRTLKRGWIVGWAWKCDICGDRTRSDWARTRQDAIDGHAEHAASKL